MRILIALGGNALSSPDGRSGPREQVDAARRAMVHVARLVAAGHEVVLTHGNGPQVGDLLAQAEIAAAQVPPVPLDWRDAETQGAIGYVLLSALASSLAAYGRQTPVAALVTRTLVDASDPGFRHPTKPVGRYRRQLPAMDHGQVWENMGPRGWRRLVASPEPLEILDIGAIRTLVGAGYVVIAAGGGGIPTVRDDDGQTRGVEAVIDKDLTAALLARQIGADILVIATDVENAAVGFGSPGQRDLAHVTATELRAYAAAGEFAEGSMRPKVEAALRFAEAGGRAVITSLARITDAVDGRAGTVVEAG